MASSYPGALDALATNKQDDTVSQTGADAGISATTGDHPQHHNDLADAINKVEAELGIQPRGLYAATVRERFEISAFKMQSCRAATTATIAGTYANGTAGVGATIAAGGTTLTVDAIAMANGDRLLLKNQTAAANNGIYVVSGVGTAVVLTRSIDADTALKIADCKVLVDTGTINADTEWYCSATSPTVGTTALPFRRTQPIYGHGNPRSPWDVAAPTTQVVMPTIPRVLVASAFSMAVAATQYAIGGIVVPAGRAVTNVNYVATVAGGAVTVDWLAIVRQSDRVVLAHTANTTTAPTISVVTARALTGVWTTSEDVPVWIVHSVSIATTARQIAAGAAGTAALNLLAPAIAATNGVAPTTTVPTDGTTVITAATTGMANIPLYWLT